MLRLLTYNVEYSGKDAAVTLDAIASADADLVLLQEVTPAWERAMRARFASYPHLAFHASTGTGGLAALSRLPIRSDHLLPAIDWFPAQHLVLDTDLGPLQVLNVHLRPMIEGGDPVRGFFSTPPIRLREIQAFSLALVPDLPTIVAGDFNEEAHGSALAHLESLGIRRVETGTTPTWEFHGNFRGNDIHLRLHLDHVALSSHLVATDATVLLAGASDHRPVLATIAHA